MQSRRFLFLISCSPWQPRAQAALDQLLTCAVLDQEVHLCFCGEGVLHLQASQDGSPLQLKTLVKQLPALTLYGVTHIYAERAACDQHGLLTQSALVVPVTLLEPAAMATLVQSCDVVERCR